MIESFLEKVTKNKKKIDDKLFNWKKKPRLISRDSNDCVKLNNQDTQ